MAPLRVLHVQKASGVSGAERHVLSLLPALAAYGVEVEACVLVTGAGQSFVERLRAVGVPTHVLAAGPDINPLLVGRLAGLARRTRVDLIHTHLVHADVHGALAGRIARVPVVSSVHGRPAFYRRQPYLSAGRMVGRLVARRIAISTAVADFLAELRLARPGTVQVIPYGIDAGAWIAAPGEVEEARERFAIGGDEVAIGMASRLIPLKGHDALIDAVAEAADRAPALRVLLAGSGPIAGELAARAEQVAPGRVRFLDYVDDVRAFMHACDVIAFLAEPALGEGFGLAALEAMAAGRPVVATDSGALGDLVVDGRTGFIVPPRAPGRVADVLVGLASDPQQRRQMGEAGAWRAAEHYSLEGMVSATADLYRSVAAGS